MTEDDLSYDKIVLLTLTLIGSYPNPNSNWPRPLLFAVSQNGIKNGDFEIFGRKSTFLSIYLYKNSPLSGSRFDGKVIVIR